jgi:hypothetical protein
LQSRVKSDRLLEHLLDWARLIGVHIGSWAETIVKQRGPIGSRVFHGLLALAQRYPVQAKALHHGTWRLRDLHTLLEQGFPLPQLDFMETHSLIRNLDSYRDCVPDCFTTARPASDATSPTDTSVANGYRRNSKAHSLSAELDQ